MDEISGGIVVGNKLYDVAIKEITPAGCGGNTHDCATEARQGISKKNHLAICFIMRVDKSRYCKILGRPRKQLLKRK